MSLDLSKVRSKEVDGVVYYVLKDIYDQLGVKDCAEYRKVLDYSKLYVGQFSRADSLKTVKCRAVTDKQLKTLLKYLQGEVVEEKGTSSDVRFLNFEGQELRVIETEEEDWIVLKDVCKVLGVLDHKEMRHRLDQETVRQESVPHPNTPNNLISMTFISIQGILQLIDFHRESRSKKVDYELTQRFETWVNSVLNSSRMPDFPMRGGRTGLSEFKSDNILNSVNSSDVMIFKDSSFGDLDVLIIDGNPYFIATRVAAMLGYANPTKAIRSHCRRSIKYSLALGAGVQRVKLIPESELYRLILSSRLPAVQRFEDWVVEEVIPSIRKTGSYLMNDKSSVPSHQEALRGWADELDRVEQLKSEKQQLLLENLDLKTKVELADRIIINISSIINETKV